jgi:hypothetical protein
MQTYVVQPGDSPARIATRFAGCPKCVVDLVAANPHKPSRTYPNGFRTFDTLRVGERLLLPRKWFDGTLDRMPRIYFDRLPAPPVGVSAAPPPFGVGATIGGSLSHCDAFSMNVTPNPSTADPREFFPTIAYDVIVSPQQSDGSYNINGTYTGPAGWSWTDGTDWESGSDTLVINSFAVNAKSTVGACAPAGGQVKPGGGVPPGGLPGGWGNVVTCKAGTVPDAVTGACVQPCPSGAPPVNGSCKSGVGTASTPFQYVTGHRIQAVGTVLGTPGNLPPSLLSASVAGIQAQYDKSAPGQYRVVMVTAAPTTITIALDYCGPNQSTLDPSTQLTPEGIAVEYVHTDLGVSPPGVSCSPATTVTAPSTSGTSTGAVAVGVVALALAAGGIWWAVR